MNWKTVSDLCASMPCVLHVATCVVNQAIDLYTVDAAVHGAVQPHCTYDLHLAMWQPVSPRPNGLTYSASHANWALNSLNRRVFE